MSNGGVIGRVVAQGEGRWAWIIRDFSELPRRENAFFSSPYFDAEGGGWYLQIEPNGWLGQTQIRIWLWRTSFRPGPSVCTVGVKRADHQEETGTENCGGISSYTFKRTRRELEEEAGVWLPGGRLTLTLHFGPPKAAKEFASRETQTDAVDENSTNTGATRKVSTRETQTDGRIGNDQKLEDCTAAKGARRLIENVTELLSAEDGDYDVRIFVKGREFRAHRVILKVRSPVLSMMLTHDSKEKKSGTIHIPDCDPDCFQEFLLFLYSGRAENLDTSKALGLYYAADKYDLPDLKEECVTFLEASLSVTSVCDVVLLAARHGETQLLETATDFFVKNMKSILFTVEWQNFMAQNPTVANELLIKSCQSKDT